MFTQEFPYPGKRDLRVRMATKEAQVEWQNYLSAQLGVISRLKQAWYRLQHSYAMDEVLGRNRQIISRMLDVAQTRYSVGKAMQQDIFKTQTQLSILDARRIQLERERHTAESEINTLLARSVTTPIERPDVPAVHEVLPPLEEILTWAHEHAPMLTRDQRMIERAQVAVTAARKEFYPDFGLTGGYYYMGSMPPMYMFRADVKLPLWTRRQRAGVTEQANTLVQSRRTYEATQNNLDYRVKEEWLTADAALKLMNLYSATVIPQANLTLESSLATYQTGAAEFMGVLANFMTSVEYEMNYHEEMQNFHVALARIEEMTAMSLTRTEAHP
jgi:outer membrane protein TolC